MIEDIVIEEAPYEEILSHVRNSPRREVGGFLLGHRSEDGIVITHAHAAAGAEERGSHITFTHASWADLYAWLDAQGGEISILGWYHSHPGFGIFLSTHDLFIHRNFFPSEHQVAYVMDPLANTEGLFGWEGDAIVRIDRVDGGPPPDLPAAFLANPKPS